MTLFSRILFLLACFSVPLIYGNALGAAWETQDSAAGITIVPEVLIPGQIATVYYTHETRKSEDVYLHFGFNGWNMPVAGTGAGSETINGNLNYFSRRKMQFDSVKGQFFLTIDIQQSSRALHLAFCWNRCAGSDWDNNNGKDYSRPVQFPYIGPILTWNQNVKPDDGIVVAFEHSEAGAGWINYWPENKFAQMKHQTSTGPMHRFELGGLQAATRYSYQVGVGNAFQSKVYSFKTLPAAATLDALSFLVFGDAQDNGESGRFAAVAAAMASGHPDADFVISTGDMPWNDKPGDWWSFFDKGKELFAAKVLMPALGNHDTPGTGSNSNHESFNYYFSHPGIPANLNYYRFDVGPAAFFAMNSERPRELQPDGSQYLWLRQQMNHHRLAQGQTVGPLWSFAYWHIPPFNAGNRHWREQFTFRPVSKTFTNNLDWHFGGHEHLYQRMKPIDFRGSAPACMSEYGTAPGQGVGYLVVPSGGAFPESQLVSRQQSSEARAVLAFPDVAPTRDRVAGFAGFTRVEVTGPSISLRTFGLDAGGQSMLIDSLQYTKPAAL